MAHGGVGSLDDLRTLAALNKRRRGRVRSSERRSTPAAFTLPRHLPPSANASSGRGQALFRASPEPSPPFVMLMLSGRQSGPSSANAPRRTNVTASNDGVLGLLDGRSKP